MASLKQITVGTTSYDIIPDAITDSSANYKASCPTISSNTTVEVASNKTTIINSSSTATQYPSAKAVYTAIQNASKAGIFASNIGTSTSSTYVPLISTGGMFSTTYLKNLVIGKKIDTISCGNGSIIDQLSTSGTISEFDLAGSSKVIKLNTSSAATIGDSNIPTAGSTTIGQNGLCGSGTIYIAATGSSSNPSTSAFAFKGSIINKAGATSGARGGYIETISNNNYATINKIENSLQGTIETILNYGSIYQVSNINGGSIQYINFDGSSSANIILVPGNTAHIRIGDNQGGGNFIWNVVENGKINPWQEVSAVATLVSLLNTQTGALYKYTGSTTTYNGVTYTNGNFYRYEA